MHPRFSLFERPDAPSAGLQGLGNDEYCMVVGSYWRHSLGSTGLAMPYPVNPGWTELHVLLADVFCNCLASQTTKAEFLFGAQWC